MEHGECEEIKELKNKNNTPDNVKHIDSVDLDRPSQKSVLYSDVFKYKNQNCNFCLHIKSIFVKKCTQISQFSYVFMHICHFFVRFLYLFNIFLKNLMFSSKEITCGQHTVGNQGKPGSNGLTISAMPEYSNYCITHSSDKVSAKEVSVYCTT